MADLVFTSGHTNIENVRNLVFLTFLFLVVTAV